LSELLGIPVFGIWGGAKDFKSDKIHMRSGSEAGKPLVQRLLAELGLPYDPAVAAKLEKEQVSGSRGGSALPLPASATPASAAGSVVLLLLGAGALAFAIYRKQKGG
jgi:hypothetical protein